MAVLGSDIMIDMHPTPDADVESVRGVVQENGRVDPTLAGELQRRIEETASDIFEARDLTDCSLSVELEFVKDRVPGAPRERINARLNVEAEEDQVSTISTAVGPPARSRIADVAEESVLQHLEEGGLARVVDTTVIVTPVQFE